jgi:hypothetical protein
MIIDRPIDVNGYTIENRALLIEKVQNVIEKNYDRATTVGIVPQPLAAKAIQLIPDKA